MTIAILYNTYSAKGQGVKILAPIENELKARSISYHAYKNEWPNDLSAYTRIWILGGDGTFNYFINKYKKFEAPVSLFAAGTGNDFHWKLYGNASLTEQVALCLKDKVRYVDLGLCNDSFFANICGLGFDGAVLRDMHVVRNIGGHLGYLVIVLKNIFTYKERELSVQINNEEAIKMYMLICIIANSSRTGGGFMISPLSRIDDGLLNFVFCKKMSIIPRIKYLLKVERGRHLALAQTHHEFIKNLTIKAGEPLFYQLDGDLKSDTDFVISVKEHVLPII
jgi:diacylglycerol kinase (ATP)